MSEHRPYRPSNGTEGCCFYEAWCFHCSRDKPMSEGKDFDECGPDEVCQILADTAAYDVEDPEYPKAWTFDAAGRPCCTAFLPIGEEPKHRCPLTADLFPEELHA